MLSLLGWGCGLRCFPLTRRWLLNYWPRSWSWARIMPQLICSAEYDRTIAIRQTQPQPVRAFPKSLLTTNRWYHLFSKTLHLFSHESLLRWSENLNAMNEQTNAMIGRELLKTAAKFGLVAVNALSVVGDLSASSAPAEATSSFDGSNTAPKATDPSCGEPDPQ